MVTTHILGYPRIGARRELKFALEAYWRGESDEAQLRFAVESIRTAARAKQRDAGMAFVSAGDFSLYDHVLDHAVLFGSLPARFGFDARKLTLEQYFALARGSAGQPALELTKWFDTNYHYLVPELDDRARFDGGPDWYFDEIAEARAQGSPVKPVLLGPLTFLRLAKARHAADCLRHTDRLARAYAAVLQRLQKIGVDWVQIDEPVLALNLDASWLDAARAAYRILARDAPRLLIATYFADITPVRDFVARLPIDGVHLDLVRAAEQAHAWRASMPSSWILSAGIVDGRNVWRTDLRRALALLKPLQCEFGQRLWIAPSCSLLHVPIALDQEEGLDAEVAPWLAFADEKLAELRTLAVGLDKGEGAIREELQKSDRVARERAASTRVLNAGVRMRIARLRDDAYARPSPFAVRAGKQRASLDLPLLPTTTIGSFPQTAALRRVRAAFRRGDIGHLDYLESLRAEIRRAIEAQEAIGLDVLVHGEPERTDMVEYFAERLWGYALSRHGWVQSYGSRCVRPPILYGDICRPEAMTVEWARYAQSLTTRPVKGMLTGPVTMLQWSFVRDDQPRAEVALQLALAIRDEVADLQEAGIRVIQIDEPALREGLPLRQGDWRGYLEWAVRAFRLAASAAHDETQIHTHMCYAEFDDILPAIVEMDADVVTIEASRSGMSLLEAFRAFRYPNGIGPGVYDIHSPRVPAEDDMAALIQRAASVLPTARLWVNPDCGLKTRDWAEVEPALYNMVRAAHRARAQFVT